MRHVTLAECVTLAHRTPIQPVVLYSIFIFLAIALQDEMSVLGVGFYQINFPPKMRLILQCDLYKFFPSLLCIFWLVRLTLRSDV